MHEEFISSVIWWGISETWASHAPACVYTVCAMLLSLSPRPQSSLSRSTCTSATWCFSLQWYDSVKTLVPFVETWWVRVEILFMFRYFFHRQKMLSCMASGRLFGCCFVGVCEHQAPVCQIAPGLWARCLFTLWPTTVVKVSRLTDCSQTAVSYPVHRRHVLSRASSCLRCKWQN